MLRGLAEYIASIGAGDQEARERWALTAEFKRDFQGKPRAWGEAVPQWLATRQGIDGIDTVKPDVHVHRFAGAAPVGLRLSDADTVAVAAAHGLWPKAFELDWAVWEQAVAGRPPNGPEAPEPSPLGRPAPLLCVPDRSPWR
jgi:hypothetical protein